MSRRLDYTRTSWENRYWSTDPEYLGPWKPPTALRRPLPMKTLQFKAGDRLYDKRFGTGTVLAKRNGAFVWVQFRGGEMSYSYFEALNLKSKP